MDGWKNKVANVHQIGGIETAILDNGTARGMRVAYINTGAGLRLKVLIDRCMDVSEAFYNEYSLTWLSQNGPSTIQPSNANNANLWLTHFGGGLVTTCGLQHIGNSESDANETRPLNGTIHAQPAEIIAIIQPDLHNQQLEMKLVGIIKESTPFGTHLILKRTILATLGIAQFSILDEIVNTGNISAPHMLMYHCNFGWPLVDAGTELFWDGSLQSRGTKSDDAVFNKPDYTIVKAPVVNNNGSAEACAFIDTYPNKEGNCSCGLINRLIGLKLTMVYDKTALPWLTNWQHFENNEYVVGLEPGTNPPIGQSKAKLNKMLRLLAPKESVNYHLHFTIEKLFN